MLRAVRHQKLLPVLEALFESFLCWQCQCFGTQSYCISLYYIVLRHWFFGEPSWVEILIIPIPFYLFSKQMQAWDMSLGVPWNLYINAISASVIFSGCVYLVAFALHRTQGPQGPSWYLMDDAISMLYYNHLQIQIPQIAWCDFSQNVHAQNFSCAIFMLFAFVLFMLLFTNINYFLPHLLETQNFLHCM